jgi:hemerythrin-like domain-containing protein
MLQVADVLDSMAEKANETSQYSQPDAEVMLKILRTFGDDCHQAKEEGALFPAFSAACNPSQYAAVQHMLFEHDQDRSLIEGMEDAVRRSNAPQFSEYAHRLAHILRTHIYKEDNILFQIIDSTLTKEADDRVVAEFEAFEEDFELHRKNELMRQLRTLEWRYLGKAA